MFIEKQSNIFLKTIKMIAFWFALISCFALLLALYEYEITKPSQKISIELDITNHINICEADPIIDRALYERF